ncbi:MAG: type III-B CRISPR module-associated protein Cmr3 [Methylococcales bacterium]|nr:type III-B CRISPR module-associated protein Cmr3 [Methylococcales bacterium]
MSRLTWRFTAFDSLFFRESRPFDTIGGSELSSVFPPSPVTMAGAIRSVIGDSQKDGVIWSNYPKNYPELQTQIGDSDSLGNMRLKGVFLSRKNPKTHDWERLYPVPAHLVAIKEKAEIKDLHFLQVGKPVQCDLGVGVCLAVAPKDIKGIKPLDGYWLTLAGLSQVLNGQLPDTSELIASSELFKHEARLGIGRNNQHRTAEKGMLYQTQHIRPKNSVAIEVDVEGLNATEYPRSGITRLGGEGRGAAFDVIEISNNLIKIDDSKTDILGIKLVLLSAVYMPQLEGYTPLPDFKKTEPESKTTVWQGQINSVALTLHCAVIGKVLREGGWDLRKFQAKPVRSLIPAGSVFYCTVEGDIKVALKKLQPNQIDSDNKNSLDNQLGRGLFTAGFWFKHDSIDDKETHS